MNRKQWLVGVTMAWGGALVAIVLTANATRDDAIPRRDVPAAVERGTSTDPRASEPPTGTAGPTSDTAHDASTTTSDRVLLADDGSTVTLLDEPRVSEAEVPADRDATRSSSDGFVSGGAGAGFAGSRDAYAHASSSSSAGGRSAGGGSSTGAVAGVAATLGAIASRANPTSVPLSSPEGVDARPGNGREIGGVPGRTTGLPNGFVVRDEGDVPAADVQIPFDGASSPSRDELAALGAPPPDVALSGAGPSSRTDPAGPAHVPGRDASPGTAADVANATTVPEPAMPALLGIAVAVALMRRRRAPQLPDASGADQQR